MRKIGLIAATAAASIGITSIAQAIDTDNSLTVKTSGKKGTKRSPKPQRLAVTTTTSAKNSAENGTFSTKKVVVHFDKKLDFRGIKGSRPAPKAIVASNPKKCPKGSKVGTGKAKAVVGEGQIKVNPRVEAYNDKRGKINIKLVARPGEVDSSGILVGKLKKDTRARSAPSSTFRSRPSSSRSSG